MQNPVLEVFHGYSDEISRATDAYLSARGESPMYGMMRYFMGFADESLRPVATFGGKRFRSGLCLLIADCYGSRAIALPAAVSIELFHNFTLIHDDVVDRDELRRGRPTVWKLWGDHHAINTGDAQFLLSMNALIDGVNEHPERYVSIMRFLNERYLEVAEGQYLDFSQSDLPLDDPAVTEEVYFTMIKKKTAVLIGAATKAAGMAAGCDEDEQEALWRYGLSLGLAYQLCDDLVSIWGNPELTGKTPRGDLKEKKKTIPVIYATSQLSSDERSRLEDLYHEQTPLSEDQVEEAFALLEETDAYDHSRALIDRYAGEAKAALTGLSIEDGHKNTLKHIVDALLPDVRALSHPTLEKS